MFALTNSVQAGIVAIGDPFPTHSWAQAFVENGNNLYSQPIGVINRMEVFAISGSPFKAIAFSNFDDSSWLGTGAVATGNPVDTSVISLNFNLNWNDPQETTVFDFYAWNAGVLKDAARATWNGGWSFALIPTTELHVTPVPELLVTPVPEPTTMIAGALLLLPFAASTVRRFRKS